MQTHLTCAALVRGRAMSYSNAKAQMRAIQ